MPSMANITVKKHDGSTDIVYDALSPSAGDNVPAVWRQDTGNTAGLPVGLRSSFKVWTRDNGPKTARQIKMMYDRPYPTQDSTTTLYSAKDKVHMEVIITTPNAMPASEIGEAVYQALNLMATALIKSVAETGYAPA
jgi:hypothetical protein